VTAPPSSDPAASTTDLFFQLEAGTFRPGQRVSVIVPLRSRQKAAVVPWSAIVFDVHGGAWVYANTAPHVFSRRRVEVRHVTAADAVLASGPPPGTRVVTVGAAEIFGTEFGTGK
jgi:hypothetical protein